MDHDEVLNQPEARAALNPMLSPLKIVRGKRVAHAHKCSVGCELGMIVEYDTETVSVTLVRSVTGPIACASCAAEHLGICLSCGGMAEDTGQPASALSSEVALADNDQLCLLMSGSKDAGKQPRQHLSSTAFYVGSHICSQHEHSQADMLASRTQQLL